MLSQRAGSDGRERGRKRGANLLRFQLIDFCFGRSWWIGVVQSWWPTYLEVVLLVAFLDSMVTAYCKIMLCSFFLFDSFIFCIGFLASEDKGVGVMGKEGSIKLDNT